jgi:hypothetical protein
MLGGIHREIAGRWLGIALTVMMAMAENVLDWW